MKTYWDLSDQERAALTAEDVQRYLDAELMLKGVLKVRPLVLEPVPEVPEPTGKAFVVRFGGRFSRDHVGVAFTTIEAAQAFVALRPLRFDSEYLESSSVQYTVEIGDPEIAEVPMFTEAEKNAVKAELKKAAAIKASNDKRREEYERGVRETEKALQGLWEDWARCRDEESKLREVADTFADYKRTAGDEQLAAKFLAKVYPTEQIAEAAARFGFPVPSLDAAAAE